MPYSITDTNVLVYDYTPGGLVVKGTLTAGTTPPTTASTYAVGCEITNTVTGVVYRNGGTVASPSWQNTDEISTSEIADGAVTAAKIRDTAEARTATADGLTTGLITSPVSAIKFVAVTSAAATNAITLPAASSALIGTVIYLTVGANGYELLTPASGNNTINQVDADGTNQLDVAASTTVRCTCVSATGWIAETIAATTIAITAPDND